MERKLLSDILRAGESASLTKAWAETAAAEEFKPLPAGEYVCRVVGGELITSRKNQTPGYKLTFEVIEGEYAGRRVWHDVWLTPAATPMAKRDLAKLGVTALEQLDQPMPRGIRCTVRIVVRKADDGSEYNRIRGFEVIGIDMPEADPFAPVPSSDCRPPNSPPTVKGLPVGVDEPDGAAPSAERDSELPAGEGQA